MSAHSMKARSIAPATSLTVETEGKAISVIGREAWALDNLMRYGEAGVTPINAPGPRWSHYVFKLRGYGLIIETVREEHGGPFSGSHARYVLRTPVTVKRVVRLGDVR